MKRVIYVRTERRSQETAAGERIQTILFLCGSDGLAVWFGLPAAATPKGS